MAGIILWKEGGRVRVNCWIGNKFEQFSDARIKLLTVVLFLAFVDKVVQVIDVSSRAKAGLHVGLA